MSEPGRPRVLVVSLGRFGGVTEYGWLMGKALAERADVAVVYSSSAENRGKWKTLGVPQLEIDTFSGIAGMLLSMFSLRRFARIRRFAREFGPDVVYYPGGHAWKPVLDFVLPRDARTVLTVHDPDLHPGEDSLMYRAFDAANRRKADGYVLLNRGQSRTFADRHGIAPGRVTVIPHGVFEDFPDEYPALSDVDDLAPIAPHAGGYLLFIGRIRQYKGIDALLAAYRDGVADEIPLVIAGSGEFSAEERGLLESLGDRPVYVVNRWLEPEDVSALVSGARFVVLPYTSATQSGVIPLASAFGVPAIASNTGGIAEQIVDGETGFLFVVGDTAALAVALNRAMSLGDTAYEAMSSGCREYARANWAWDGLAGQLLGFCESLDSR
jgi:glycosyltransferase involved in cell wall biosynthesis